MEKVETARKLAEELRKAHLKIHRLQEITGFEVYEFLSELEAIQDIVVDLLEVPPWESDRYIVYDYIWGNEDYTFDEMLELIDKAKRDFDIEEWNSFCDMYEKEYGTLP